MRRPGKAIFVASGIAAVVAAVIGGLIVLGPPAHERMRRMDAQRITNLRDIANAVDLYWTRHGNLPGSLEELSREPGVSITPRDPETGRPYEFRVLSRNAYELCADFAHDTAEDQDTTHRDFWSHGRGRQCFHPEVWQVRR